MSTIHSAARSTIVPRDWDRGPIVPGKTYEGEAVVIEYDDPSQPSTVYSILEQEFYRRDKLLLNAKIDTAFERAKVEDWDGEGALAVTPQTANIARRLIEFFPAWTHSITHVSSTPLGEMDFNFSLSNDTLLTIGVCPDGEIDFSGMFREIEIDADGNLPEELSCFISAFFEAMEKFPLSEKKIEIIVLEEEEVHEL